MRLTIINRAYSASSLLVPGAQHCGLPASFDSGPNKIASNALEQQQQQFYSHCCMFLANYTGLRVAKANRGRQCKTKRKYIIYSRDTRRNKAVEYAKRFESNYFIK